MTRQELEERETARFWLDMEAEGELSAQDAARLEAAMLELPELQGERAELSRLHEDLRSSRVAVRDGFRERVMESLPAASWEPVGQQRWGAAIVAASVLMVLSGLLLTLGGGSSLAPSVGLLGALGDFLRASAVTGAGLLGASWRGLGLALQKALESSPATIALFGVGVLALNILFFRLLRRNSRSAHPAYDSAAGSRSDQADDEAPHV